MIKAIAFDMDNTLVDFMKFKKESSHAAARAMVKAGLKKNIEKVEEDIFGIYLKHGIEYEGTFGTLLWDTYKFRDDFEKFERIQQAGVVAYRKRMYETLKPYPSVVPMLKKLRKKYKTAIVTDAPRNKTWRRLYASGLAKYFDIVVTTDDVSGIKKPHHLPFRLLLAKLKLKPPQVLFVGDHPIKDMAGARAIGMKTAWAKYGRDSFTRAYDRLQTKLMKKAVASNYHLISRRKASADFILEKPSDLVKLAKAAQRL